MNIKYAILVGNELYETVANSEHLMKRIKDLICDKGYEADDITVIAFTEFFDVKQVSAPYVLEPIKPFC